MNRVLDHAELESLIADLGMGGLGSLEGARRAGETKRDAPELQAISASGGFRMARVTWIRVSGPSLDGWEEVIETYGLDPTIYPSKAACEAAINNQHPRAQ